MKIYDSSKKEKIDFLPIKKNKVKMYLCGPTVYDNAHLGHARSSIAFDLLYRVLQANNYEVTYARNYTDIDDKIINKSKNTNEPIEKIVNFHINKFEEDMKALNVLEPILKPKATNHIEGMIAMIDLLLKDNKAYSLENGIYLDTSKDDKYLSISKQFQNTDDLQARIETKIIKKNPQDFVLWKFKKENEPFYETSFGDGRPGWHIECSAMIDKVLSYKNEKFGIDIHCGGMDLLFPHHENEASQTRCTFGYELSKYWMHNGFVNINNEKMSKSLGNSFFVKDTLKKYNSDVLRFYLLSTHYRANLNFTYEDLESSKKRLDKIYRLKKRVHGGKGSSVEKDFKQNILNSLNDDLNISLALSFVDEFVSFANEKLDENTKDKALKKTIISNIEFLNNILGIAYQDAYEYFQFGITNDMKKNIEELISERNIAKQEKNYAKSDEIRETLSSMNISLIDTINGTLWEIK